MIVGPKRFDQPTGFQDESAAKVVAGVRCSCGFMGGVSALWVVSMLAALLSADFGACFPREQFVVPQSPVRGPVQDGVEKLGRDVGGAIEAPQARI